MKYQQISVDFVSMVFTACSYLALAGAVWIFLRLIQACFWLPRHLKRENNVQRLLRDKMENYEKYILECEEKEKIEQEMQGEDAKPDPEQAEKWKERRECLELLKRELSKIRDNGDDSQDWDYLLENEGSKDEEVTMTEVQVDGIAKDGLNEKNVGIAKDGLNEKINADKQIIKPEKKKNK